jgi:hypothetical protein
MEQVTTLQGRHADSSSLRVDRRGLEELSEAIGDIAPGRIAIVVGDEVYVVKGCITLARARFPDGIHSTQL